MKREMKIFMDKKRKVLLAGATGYLGGYILEELLAEDYSVKVIVRNPAKLKQGKNLSFEVVQAEITKPEEIKGCCEDVDVVISTVGITRQRDGLTYMDVDYQANLNLLEEAKKSRVKKFIYVSVLKGDKLTDLKICDAKEKFVQALMHSGLEYSIIRPNGFFSDITEFYNMAKKGQIYLFGNGEFKLNPIHGKDLAEVCVDAIDRADKVIEVGGPQTLTQNEIAYIAFDVLNKKPKITHIPDWVRKTILKLVRTFTTSKTYGPIEFFLTVLALDDMIAPEYGRHTLKEYFEGLREHVE